MIRVIACLVCLVAVSASAQVTVSKGAGQKSSIDLSALTANDAASQTFRTVLEADLIRSGWFVRAPAGQGEYAVRGSAQGSGGGITAQCTAFGRATQKTYLNKSYRSDAQGVRRLAHAVADEIILAVTGRKGMNGMRIAMIGNRSGKKEVYLADADGQGLIQLTRDNNISVSPSWSPDGRQLYYTSWLKGYADIYQVDIGSGSRKRVSSLAGLNTGAAISPDGGSMALILSKDGNPELYVKNLSSGATTRLTTSRDAAEASPSWSPDGQRIVYVSDQSGTGKPQLYVIGRQGGAPRRLTSRGNQNVSPDWGPNGLIAYASLTGGKFQICVINPETLEVKQLTTDWMDHEDPSWAPDGRHILCARSQNYKSKVVVVDALGDPAFTLTDYQGDWYSPACSRGN